MYGCASNQCPADLVMIVALLGNKLLLSLQDRGMNLIECLTFMCQISFLTLGKV